jgi:hypothetical protein
MRSEGQRLDKMKSGAAFRQNNADVGCGIKQISKKKNVIASGIGQFFSFDWLQCLQQTPLL